MPTLCTECGSPEGHKISCSRSKAGRYTGFRTTDDPVVPFNPAADTGSSSSYDSGSSNSCDTSSSSDGGGSCGGE